MKTVDVLIVGGGVVGLTLANLLAQSSLQIALIDQHPPPLSNLLTPYDWRVSAIHLGSKAIFQSLPNVWQEMESIRVSAYQRMEVWDIASPTRLEFDSQEMAQPYLGYILEHSVMRSVLWKALEKHENVELYPDACPRNLQEEIGSSVVTLERGETIRTRLLVGAEGRQSWVGQQAGLTGIFKCDGSESAVVATVRTERSHQHTAFQRFLPTGPVALLPLLDSHLVSLVWSTTQSEANHLSVLEDVEFNRYLEQAIEYRLGKLSVCDRREIFPLIRHEALAYVKEGIALVGDAAHTILPLAGQGLNLGLADAACLAKGVITAYTAQRNIGGLAMLRRYARERRVKNRQMHRAMEGLFWMFGNQHESMRHLRAIGFAMTEKISPLKHYFMKQGAGLG